MEYLGSYWNRSHGGYLSGDLKAAVCYDGAVAYAECSQTVNLINSFESKMNEPTEAAAQASLKGREPSPVRTRSDTIINNGVPVGNDSAGDGYPAGVIARALGKLQPGELKPSEVKIILPAFDTVALFPIAMFADNINPLQGTEDPLAAFIIWLKSADDIYTPTVAPPAGTELYLDAIRKLDSVAFRKKGYNNDYVAGSVANSAYFYDAYKYSADNPKGAGWLQQGCVLSDPSYTSDLNNKTVPDKINPSYSRYYNLGFYILIDPAGKVRTNEQHRCLSGYAPGGYSGPRAGPGRI